MQRFVRPRRNKLLVFHFQIDMLRPLQQRQRTRVWIVEQVLNGCLMPAQECFNLCCRTVPQAKPEDFGWKTSQHTQLTEICIFGDDSKFMVTGIHPDILVRGAIQPKLKHVLGVWEHVSKAHD